MVYGNYQYTVLALCFGAPPIISVIIMPSSKSLGSVSPLHLCEIETGVLKFILLQPVQFTNQAIFSETTDIHS